MPCLLKIGGIQMMNKEILKNVLDEYKKVFIDTQWKNEKYKWVAVKQFQDSWDINANDFHVMLTSSLSKTFNLLASMNNFPAKMIKDFAEKAPEEVRSMFISLFDERIDVVQRISEFKDQSGILLQKYGGDAGSHYQNENAISTYLWLRYPDKYYIFKYSEVKKIAEVLECDFKIKKGLYSDNLRNFYNLYNEISFALKEDEEILSLLKSQITAECYPDPECKTLTIDIGFFISREYKDIGDWFPKDYSPGISVEQWVELLNDKQVFYNDSLTIMKRMLDYGGQATCTQLAVKYGKTKNFYNVGATSLAKRIVAKIECQVLEDHNENARWWPVIYVGKHAEKADIGSYIWKLRDELSEALKKIDLSEFPLFESENESINVQYWWLNANPKTWSFNDIVVGEQQSYTLYNGNGNKRRVFQNFLDAKPDDIIIGYESNPVKQIVALGKFVSEQDGSSITFEKIESLTSPIDYHTLKSCPELEKMEYFVSPQGSLFKLTQGEYEFIDDMIREENPVAIADEHEKYTKLNFLNEVFMTENKYDTLVSVLKNKKNIILQGAPGVGKTFAAKRLAYSIMGEKDENRIEFIQFHQNYSYEDFVMGYKPVNDGFELKYGIFYRFCQKASNTPHKDYFFIIDEINRGNLSKIFGELLMLVERDYRDTKATLAYNGLSFSVPKNVHIIGMMNTADRSLAMIDYALRRRFSFFNIDPGFETNGFSDYRKQLNDDTLDRLVEKVIDLNKAIIIDKTLGNGFCIGHSYFCGQVECTEEWLLSIVNHDIIPMLHEYWFDDVNQLKNWENILRGVFQ